MMIPDKYIVVDIRPRKSKDFEVIIRITITFGIEIGVSLLRQDFMRLHCCLLTYIVGE